MSLQAMHDTQPGDGGAASSTVGPRDPGEELHAALNEQTRLNEEISRLNQRQRAGGQTKEDALRYTTIMALLAQMGPRIMDLCNQTIQHAIALQSSASASSSSAKPDKQDHLSKQGHQPPPKVDVQSSSKVEVVKPG